MQQFATPSSAPAGPDEYLLVKPARSALTPWSDPTAYFALPLAALGAGILRQPVAAFIGGIIVLAAGLMMVVGFSMAREVQRRLVTTGATKDAQAHPDLSVIWLLGLFGSVLFAVSPLFGGGVKESQPVEFGRVFLGFLPSTFCAVLLVASAVKGAVPSAVRCLLQASYWLCFVPAAAYVAAHFAPGWRGGN